MAIAKSFDVNDDVAIISDVEMLQLSDGVYQV